MSQQIFGSLKSKDQPKVPDAIAVEGRGSVPAVVVFDSMSFFVEYIEARGEALRAEGKRARRSAMGDVNDKFDVWDRAAKAFSDARTLDCVVTTLSGEDVHVRLTGFDAGIVAHLVELGSKLVVEGELRDGVLHATGCEPMEAKVVVARS